jgi:putative membrane protein
MKRSITLVVTILFFILAVVIGLKNQQLIHLNYLIAQNEIRLSTLLAIIFSIGFIASMLVNSFFYLKLKMQNLHLRKLNKKQHKELNELRSLTVKE